MMSDLELGRQDGPRNGAAEREARSTRVIAVTSGKGGVGKTCFTANVAIALQRAQKRILVFDADLGLANIDVMLGLRPEYTLQDVLEGEKRIEEIIVRGPA
ncbi:MAG: Flagellum site-determining protein YlxH [candidate division BRC1 bacterium ADurb.BinA364]|nr:MAG: Flagellum site-determining protein YlxH [candidate division BRC1 bacterium ADurb.BinA364]